MLSETRKRFEELTINNDWMFKQVFSDPNNIGIVKEVAERCIKRKINKISLVEPEKNEDFDYDTHGVRFDIMFEGDDFYCVMEMQTYKDSLELRSKYYHDIMDRKHFRKGLKYKDMKPTYVIWFLSRDVFKGDLPLYTAKTQIVENSQLKYDDKRVTIYVNPGVYEEVNDITAICEYLKNGSATDTLTEEINESIERIKSQDEAWRMYMSLDEWLEHKEEIGLAKGREEEKREIAYNLSEMGISSVDISKATGLAIEAIEKLKQK